MPQGSPTKMEAERHLARTSPRVFTTIVRTTSSPQFPHNQSSWEGELGPREGWW